MFQQLTRKGGMIGMALLPVEIVLFGINRKINFHMLVVLQELYYPVISILSMLLSMIIFSNIVTILRRNDILKVCWFQFMLD